jgi:hypothetical protein
MAVKNNFRNVSLATLGMALALVSFSKAAQAQESSQSEQVTFAPVPPAMRLDGPPVSSLPATPEPFVSGPASYEPPAQPQFAYADRTMEVPTRQAMVQPEAPATHAPSATIMAMADEQSGGRSGGGWGGSRGGGGEGGRSWGGGTRGGDSQSAQSGGGWNRGGQSSNDATPPIATPAPAPGQTAPAPSWNGGGFREREARSDNGGGWRGGGWRGRGQSDGGTPSWSNGQVQAPQAAIPNSGLTERRPDSSAGSGGWAGRRSRGNDQGSAMAPSWNGGSSRENWANRGGASGGYTANNGTYVDPNRNRTYRDSNRDYRSGWRDRSDDRNRDRWRSNRAPNGGQWGYNNSYRRGHDNQNGHYGQHGWNNSWRGGNNWSGYSSGHRWDRGWRHDNRYNWHVYRNSNRDIFRMGRYYAPYRNYSYRRLSIGIYLDSLFYSSNYWINDPWRYRLPDVDGPYRWVRYYDDALLIDTYSGEVVDVIHDFFW